MGRINTKAKGTRLELRCRHYLESLGYSCTRAAASLGAWDVIAIGPTDIRVIQVKANRRPGSKEMTTLREFEAPPNVSKEVWVYKDGKPSEPLIEIVCNTPKTVDRREP